MEAVIIVLLVVVIGAVLFFVWEGRESRRALNAQMENQRTEIDRRLEVQQVDITARLGDMQKAVTDSLTGNTETMQHVNERLGHLAQSTQEMLNVGRDISSLQDILRPPKLRGGFGELLLERLLAQILPDDHFDTQYRFKSGLQVDAVIHLGNSLVPVDSKFPLEAFNRMLKAESDEEQAAVRREFVRAVRGHIDAVARYIQPEDGTFPFALMYIPAENVYYEIIVKEDLLDGRGNLSTYALEQRVIPVSPNSFYAYLQVIVLGLKGLRVEERAHEIIRHLEQLAGDFESIRKGFGTLGDHLKNASNRYAEIDHAFERFGSRLELPLAEGKGTPLGQPTQPVLPESVPVNGNDEPD